MVKLNAPKKIHNPFCKKKKSGIIVDSTLLALGLGTGIDAKLTTTDGMTKSFYLHLNLTNQQNTEQTEKAHRVKDHRYNLGLGLRFQKGSVFLPLLSSSALLEKSFDYVTFSFAFQEKIFELVNYPRSRYDKSTHKMVPYFDIAMGIIVFLNAIVLSSYYYGMSLQVLLAFGK